MRTTSRRLVLVAAAILSLTAWSEASGAAAQGPLGDDVTLGNANAKVTVVEYASAACPHCAAWNETVFPAFKAKYIDTGKIHFVFREILTDPPQVAAAGFLLARCGGKDKYFPILDAVFRSQKEWGATGDVRGSFLRIAQSFGMNEQQFVACVSDEKALNALNARVERYSTQYAVHFTPTFVVNGKTVPGPVTLLQVDAAIAAARAAPPAKKAGRAHLSAGF